jgi:heat shock protein HslJ
MRKKWFVLVLCCLLPLMAACNPVTAPAAPAAETTPTPDPDIYNQVPDTTVYEPGACIAVLEAPAPAHASNTLGSAPSGEIPPGRYEVGVAADYGSSLWFMLNDVVAPDNWINSTSAASLEGVCAPAANPLVGPTWQVTDYADPRNTTGMTTVLLDTTLTAVFGADNTISGAAGCNSYAGTYLLEGDSLTIPGPLATTMMACAEEVMAQETVFLTNLQAVAGYKIDDVEPQLHLLNEKGQGIILLKQQ